MSLLPKKFYFDNFLDDFDFMETNKKSMSCDIYEKDNKYHIVMDIPGFDKKDVSVKYTNNYLTIEASKEQENNDEGKNYIRRERFYGNFKRQFYIEDIDEDQIDAEFKNGTLKIVIPKIEAKPTSKQIEIK